MKRDGACTSLWQNTVREFNGKPGSIENKIVDVLIVGGGITGVATGLQLQKQGKQCIIAESHSLCFGTTGGTTAHLNTFFDTSYDVIDKKFGESNAQLMAKAAKESLNLIKQNVTSYNIECGYEIKDGYLFSQSKEQTEELDRIYMASVKSGVEVSYSSSIPVDVPFEKAICYQNQAQFHPTRYVTSLAKEFEKAGGQIFENCHVNQFSGDENMLEIETEKGIIKARYLIYATHIPPGINLLHFRCAPYRSYAVAAILKNDNYPDGLAYDMYDPYHYYRTQEVDGINYLIAGGEDHKTAHEQNTESCFTRLEAHLKKYFDIKEIAYKWSSQFFEPADGLAYIGRLPGNPDNVLVASGYGGNGMTYSHIAAIALSDIIVKGKSEFEELYNPKRIKIAAGFTNFVKENIDVVEEFIGKRLHKEKLEELADLAPGDAKVVKYEGAFIALYKNPKGVLHAINPVCTHAKCIVSWNNAEKSWDCPCHGARYTAEGEVLTGPASKNLEVVSLEKIIAGHE
jgi:glycine/D-amino acid oxidase-like deaminating enzyme/nitrite reductase/ring-hydroxylating ferredoxin subunit